MLNRIRYYLLGPPLATKALAQEKLNKIRGLAAFSPDALSSIAYANQEIYLGLVVAGSSALLLSWPIGMAIILVLLLVSISYFQTIHAYPSGGGSYIVAHSNLGTIPGLVAAAALFVDYILTAAVSLTAGVAAISSAFPVLHQYRIFIALFLLLVITLLNLRGLRETGTWMAIPVYFFLITYIGMLLIGVIKFSVEGPTSYVATAPPPLVPITLLLVLHAFSSGCTALTGIEAISNGIPAFKSPESRNAGITLIVMAVLMGILFVGSIGLTQGFAVVAGPQETILSALARHILGTGPYYFIVQLSTLLILTVAANTSFADFPRIASILARDGFLPRQFTRLGDRLVFANGIIALAVVTGLLIVIFGGYSHLLIPLFAVGAFTAFTLSQTGMVVHWWRSRERGWRLKAFLNGLGALATGFTLFIIGISKFIHGAWITIIIILISVIIFSRIKRHYEEVANELTMRGLPPSLKPGPTPRIVVPVSGVHRGIVEAIAYAQSISDNVTAVYIELEPGQGEAMRERWERWWPDVPLVIVSSPYRSLLPPLLEYLDQTDLEHNDGQLATVLIPEFVPAKWWQGLLHNQSAWMIKAALLYRRRHLGFQRAIIDVPHHLKR
jgi:amino acid transporter